MKTEKNKIPHEELKKIDEEIEDELGAWPDGDEEASNEYFETSEKLRAKKIKNYVSQNSEKNIKVLNKDVWIRDKEVNWYKEELYHSFKDSEIKFELSRKGLNLIENPLFLSMHDGDDTLTLRINGDILHAKSVIEKSINYFDQQQHVHIYSIKNYFLTNPSFSPELQSANSFNENKQGETPPLERRNINSKENFMSDQLNTEEKTIRLSSDPAAAVAKEEAFVNALHQRKMVLNALATKTLACLPGENGFTDTKPAFNIVSGDIYQGVNLLDIKDHQKQNGFPTAEYITENMINNAREEYPDLKILQDQKTKGIFIHWEEKIKGTDDEWERKSSKLYNIAQTTNPEQIKAWADKKQQEEYQKYVDFKKKDNPSWTPPELKQKSPAPIIECSSTEPEKYLGQYFAAVSLGGKFKVSPEQADEFTNNMKSALTELKENGYPDPFKLSKISNKANKYSKDFIRETNMMLQREFYKEQKQEQTQSLGRSM